MGNLQRGNLRAQGTQPQIPQVNWKKTQMNTPQHFPTTDLQKQKSGQGQVLGGEGDSTGARSAGTQMPSMTRQSRPWAQIPSVCSQPSTGKELCVTA